MKAVIFRNPDEELSYEDVTLDPPKAGEVRVRIAAAGVCHSDLHVKRGEWESPAPLVMGHEGAGIVVELGEGVTSLAVGDHVVLSPDPPSGSAFAWVWEQRNVLLTGENGGVEARFTPSRKDTS